MWRLGRQLCYCFVLWFICHCCYFRMFWHCTALVLMESLSMDSKCGAHSEHYWTIMTINKRTLTICAPITQYHCMYLENTWIYRNIQFILFLHFKQCWILFLIPSTCTTFETVKNCSLRPVSTLIIFIFWLIGRLIQIQL